MNNDTSSSPQEFVTRFVLKRYDQPSRVSEIVAALSLEIIEGIKPPGSELNSVALAATFETSRTPVREALMVLEKEGLVEMPPRRRPFVSRPNIVDIRENYDIRATLMAIVMGRVAKSANEHDLAELGHLYKVMEAQVNNADAEAYFWANVAFHEHAMRIAGNSLFTRILDMLFLRALRFRRIGLQLPGRQKRSLDDHGRLMRALEERDAELASALIRSIITSALATIEKNAERLF